ncbi:alanine racemase [Thalassobaculum litoreum]|uniref:Alanine racemase n=1 Tax=Thalassobaculum litoreum DSM 18839 TaxID=1123362 RepID=A0A8G2BH92_9PROT|nr:alanine racemase [Thalassobaculum litoreum]SDF68337.1 alanine racemase [Thalassobaculum litoreum DSM 18839]
MVTTTFAFDATLSRLTIDLGAVRQNYRRLRRKLGDVPCAGVVKADGYGLGADHVASVLYEEGCRTFFVATFDEAVGLRQILPEGDIACLNGLLPGTEAAYVEHRLTPVLNDLGQVARWRAHGVKTGAPLAAMLHVDTGMNRLGLDGRQMDQVAEDPALLDGIDWQYVLSHLCAADAPDSPMNAQQLARFTEMRRRLPGAIKASLANSSGIFLGSDYHHDLARPGIALYGGRPSAGGDNPMRCPIRIEGRILQVRTVERGWTVGYGGSWRAGRETRIATVAAGYADGYLRSLSSVGRVAVGGRLCNVVGRVSMDMITVDVTDIDPADTAPGGMVEVLGPTVTPDAMADLAGTIGYELLTSLGSRYVRHYVDSAE